MLHLSEMLGADTENYLYRTKKSFLILFLVRNLPIFMERIFVFSVFLYVNFLRICTNVPMISIGRKEIRSNVIPIKREKSHSLTSIVLIILGKEFLSISVILVRIRKNLARAYFKSILIFILSNGTYIYPYLQL